MTNSFDNRPLTCDEAVELLPSYAAGTLPDNAAWRLEWHVAHCATCEMRLAQTEMSIPSPDVIVGQLAPSAKEVASMRAHVLRHSRRSPGRWMAPVGLAAAAVLTIVLVNRDPNSSTTPLTPDSTVAITAPDELTGASAPVVTAMHLASAQAAPEFAALEAAKSEIDAAIASAPNDRELRAFRSTLEARREELTQRIKSVSE